MTSLNNFYDSEENSHNSGNSNTNSNSNNSNSINLRNSSNSNPLSFSSLIPINRNRKMSDPSVFDNHDRNSSSSSSINIENDYLMDNHQSPNNSSNNLLPYLIPNVMNISSSDINNSNNNNNSSSDNYNSNNNNLSNSTGINSSTTTTTTTSRSLSLGGSGDNAFIKHSSHNLHHHHHNSHNINSNNNNNSNSNNKKKVKKSERNLMCWVSFVLVITQLLGIFMFSQGFFPRKTTLEGYNTFNDYSISCTDTNVTVEPQFGKVVFMLVDAFRSSFLFGDENSETMNFTQSLLDSGRAHGYIARADAPTVTLPRIKALLSGGIPSFVDFINNFNSQTLKEDNLLYQMKQSNKSMLFFGDDTWLKLFPDYFKRNDGTTSFYVADTVEVDLNVTRHLEPELNNDDWDVMFLHYLGLDHIGHLEGPHSDLMKPKQREIDGIIKLIHTKILENDKIEMEKYKSNLNNSNNNNNNNQEENNSNSNKPPLPTLFIFCSDHGMNEIGNHGGSSDSETSAVLVLMSSLYYNQNDLIVDHNNFEIKNDNHHESTTETTTETTTNENENNNNNTEQTDNKKEQKEQEQQEEQILINNKEIEDNIMSGQGRSDAHYKDPEILPKFQPGLPPKEISQVDLVPTLSLLLGLPIPKNSLGSLIPELFEKFIPSEQYLRALEINCQQQIEIIKHNSIFWKDGVATNQEISNLLKLFSDAQQYHSSWISTPTHSTFNDNAAELYLEFLKRVQDQFTSLLTTFDDNLLMVGILLIGSSALVTLLITISTIGVSEHNGTFEIKGVNFIMTFVGLFIALLTVHFGIICKNQNTQDLDTTTTTSNTDSTITSSSTTALLNSNNLNPICTNEFRYGVFSFIFTALSLLIGFNAIVSKNNIKFWSLATLSPLQLRKEKYVLIVGTILHLISLFGSSLVEEEHLTWYFLTTSVIILQMAPHSISLFFYLTSSPGSNQRKQNSSSLRQMFILLGILFCLRIFRIWNQTGIKWLDDAALAATTIPSSLNDITNQQSATTTSSLFNFGIEKFFDNFFYIDIGRFLSSNTNIFGTVCSWFLSLASVIAPCVYVFSLLDDLEEQRGGISNYLSKLYKSTIVVLSVFLFCYKWEYISKDLINPAYIARFVYVCWLLLMVITFSFPLFSKKDSRILHHQLALPQTWFIVTLKYLPTLVIVNMYMLFCLLHKVHNMFLLTIMGTIAHYYVIYLLEDTGRRAKSGMTGVCVGMVCLNWLGQFGYFAFGNSNSLASIDISGSYTALIDYNQYLVGIQTILIGYTSQLFFFFVSIVYVTHLAVKSISNSNHQQEPSLLPTPGTSFDIIDELQWYGLVSGLLDCGIRWTNIFIFSICILIQRYHLFIWTVFSPKYIYEVLDVTLVLIKSILLACFIIYLRILSFIKEKQVENVLLLSSSQNINKEE